MKYTKEDLTDIIVTYKDGEEFHMIGWNGEKGISSRCKDWGASLNEMNHWIEIGDWKSFRKREIFYEVY